VRFRTDKNGIIHASVGKVDFEPAKLKQNVEALLSDLKRLKPSASKGVYVKRVTLSTTMARACRSIRLPWTRKNLAHRFAGAPQVLGSLPGGGCPRP